MKHHDVGPMPRKDSFCTKRCVREREKRGEGGGGGKGGREGVKWWERDAFPMPSKGCLSTPAHRNLPNPPARQGAEGAPSECNPTDRPYTKLKWGQSALPASVTV
jgi:hypothetical protein